MLGPDGAPVELEDAVVDERERLDGGDGVSDVRLYFFQCGSIDMPLRNANLGEGGGGERLVTPAQWYLLTHPRGNAVIDGGNAPEVAIDAKKHWGAITEVSTSIMAPEEAVLPAMARARLRPPRTCAGSCRRTCTSTTPARSR